MRRLRFALGLAALLSLHALSGCADELPTFPDPLTPEAVECESDAECGAGICLGQRCYARCTSDRDCAQGGTCDLGTGACVLRVVPVDAGPDVLDPCAAITCAADSYCHPVSAACVRCLETAHCPAGEFCDTGRGACLAAGSGAGADCAPCDDTSPCTLGTCVSRPEPAERVCLRPCATDAECPAGLGCDPSIGCVPTGTTCTSFFATSSARACAEDLECAAQGQVDRALCLASVGVPQCSLSCLGLADCPVGFNCGAGPGGSGACVAIPPPGP
ncbi:MAG: hypothetical protein OEY14_12530 [Myxococcales bacterium]|nr:hypothetical protein [Myxococcales bacterium]